MRRAAVSAITAYPGSPGSEYPGTTRMFWSSSNWRPTACTPNATLR